MKWYRNLANAIVETLYTIFNEEKQGDRVIQKLLQSQKKWGSRDRKFVAKALYDIIRWKRLYEYLAQNSILEESGKWQILGVWSVLNNISLPEWVEFEGINPADIKERYKKIDQKAIKESVPDWLYQLGAEQLGIANWEAQINALNQEADLFIRVNTLKTNRNKLQKILQKEGVDTETIPDLPDALLIKNRKKITPLKSYQQGLFEVQDISSQLVAPFTGVQPGMTVIDACSGAGGKTLHLAALMQNKGKIFAYDIVPNKIKELYKRARRNGVKNIVEAGIIDADKLKKNAQLADVLLIDAPCSSLGTLKRKPDLKWKLNPEKLRQINVTQLDIISRYEKMLKPGGTLIYVTCSILPQENQDIVNNFLKNHKNYTFVTEQTIFPSNFQGDGFYMAKLIKNKQT